MAQPAFQHPVAPATPDRFGAVAAGGPIAEMQRTIEERMIAASRQQAAREDDTAHRLSRLAGPALLAAAYAAVALWWF